MDTVTEGIEEARRLLSEGQDKKAADQLVQAAAVCRDPAQAAIIKSLAASGARAGGPVPESAVGRGHPRRRAPVGVGDDLARAPSDSGHPGAPKSDMGS